MFLVSRCLLLSCVILSGCSGVKGPTDYSKLGLVEVSGTVALEGKPVTVGSISFEAADKTFSASNLDSSGGYLLRFNSEQMGVTPGDKIVRISGRPLAVESGEGGTGEGGDPDAKSKESSPLPDCYGKDSPIQVKVDSSHTRFDFDLKKDCSVTAAK